MRRDVVEDLRYLFEGDAEPRLSREEVWQALAALAGSFALLALCAVLGQALA